MNWTGGSSVDRRQHLHPRQKVVPLEWDRPVDGPVMVAVGTLDLVIIIVG